MGLAQLRLVAKFSEIIIIKLERLSIFMALVELQFAKQYSINFISNYQTTNSNLILALESSSKGFRKQLF